jgi:predicted DNA-binding transcriptional regulator AlpA
MLLKDKHLAEKLEISRRKVWAMNSAALLPTPVRMGRSVRWRVEDIQRWILLGCPNRSDFEAKGDDCNA